MLGAAFIVETRGASGESKTVPGTGTKTATATFIVNEENVKVEQ